MISAKKAAFCKNEDCPTSQELLEFQAGDTALHQSRKIGKHLITCEFCAAEVAFYSHYPQVDPAGEPHEFTTIPAPLFQLAEAILKNRHDASDLNNLFKESEALIVDAA